jgi:hypothetical protein
MWYTPTEGTIMRTIRESFWASLPPPDKDFWEMLRQVMGRAAAEDVELLARSRAARGEPPLPGTQWNAMRDAMSQRQRVVDRIQLLRAVGLTVAADAETHRLRTMDAMQRLRAADAMQHLRAADHAVQGPDIPAGVMSFERHGLRRSELTCRAADRFEAARRHFHAEFSPR